MSVIGENKMNRIQLLLLSLSMVTTSASAGVITLYDQDFESPTNYINGFGSGYKDLSQQQVNDLYGGQQGLMFAQAYTVETAFLSGNEAFGTGYKDASGIGGNYAIGMLSDVQNDLLGMSFSFNLGTNDFFNLALDVSSLGLDGVGGPFTDGTVAPEFQFTLFSESGGNGLGAGSVLGQHSLTGTASSIDTLDWTRGLFSFDASSDLDGNVTLQIDLLSGGYAVLDNILITSSDTPTVSVPEPSVFALLGLGLFGLGFARSQKRS